MSKIFLGLLINLTLWAQALTTTPAATVPVGNPSVTAPAQVVPQGRSEDLSKAFAKDEIKPFQYFPVDPIFWDKVLKAQHTENYAEMMALGGAQHDTFGSSAEGAEGLLALGMGMKHRNLPYGAYLVLTDLARERIGSQIGEAALFELETVVQQGMVDREGLDHVLNGNEFLNLHPHIQSFVSYFRYMFTLRFGYAKWANENLAQIRPDSYWSYEIKYWTALGEVARGRMEKAYDMLKVLYEDKKTPPIILENVKLQIARTLFEKGQFEQAYDLYYSLGTLGVREKGRIALERSWTLYYLKEYSKALGVLRGLDNPYFNSSLTYERYILEMLIYRELCHYEIVEYVARNFSKKFNTSLKTIRQRKPLREDPVLFSMAVLNKSLQDRANLIDQIRKEYIDLKDYNFDNFAFFEPLLKRYKEQDKLLQGLLDQELEAEARKAANDLLDADEQVQFIDYTSKLDALRVIAPTEERDYRSEKISYVTFEKIYWPVEKEIWWDEVNDYRVLVSSRCGKSSTKEEKMERRFK